MTINRAKVILEEMEAKARAEMEALARADAQARVEAELRKHEEWAAIRESLSEEQRQMFEWLNDFVEKNEPQITDSPLEELAGTLEMAVESLFTIAKTDEERRELFHALGSGIQTAFQHLTGQEKGEAVSHL
jgi:hypothetical protein